MHYQLLILFLPARQKVTMYGLKIHLRKGEPTTDPNWADLSISYLDQMVEDNGPFYAILGYSQGAAMLCLSRKYRQDL